MTDAEGPADPKPREACGVFGVYAPNVAVAHLVFDGLHALQHRGQESAGMAVSDGETIFIDTDGAKVGTINGLSVISMGTYAFGRPTRITATVNIGKGDVINIEREIEMSGPSHTKGVLILASFLRSRYAQDQPLSRDASLVFEQSYSGVYGDSASSTELYALLSAIAQVPIKQSLAVTGSVNQLGQVQAIGGVNEKIEGFYDLCKARGLTGEQGVMIPQANVKHLMLRHDVVAAVGAPEADGRSRSHRAAHEEHGRGGGPLLPVGQGRHQLVVAGSVQHHAHSAVVGVLEHEHHRPEEVRVEQPRRGHQQLPLESEHHVANGTALLSRGNGVPNRYAISSRARGSGCYSCSMWAWMAVPVSSSQPLVRA